MLLAGDMEPEDLVRITCDDGGMGFLSDRCHEGSEYSGRVACWVGFEWRDGVPDPGVVSDATEYSLAVGLLTACFLEDVRLSAYSLGD